MGRNVACSGDHRFDSAHDESIPDFRKQAAIEAQALGLPTIIFCDDEDADTSRAN
jgi:hypothetical protein